VLFGLCNAPATFEQLLKSILCCFAWEVCLIYLDDAVIVGRMFQGQHEKLWKVFQRFKGARLKLNSKKCQLFQEEVQYLGHVLSPEGVTTDPETLEAVSIGHC
jgi:hypothetical protein